jgi:hypothetical protein
MPRVETQNPETVAGGSEAVGLRDKGCLFSSAGNSKNNRIDEVHKSLRRRIQTSDARGFSG